MKKISGIKLDKILERFDRNTAKRVGVHVALLPYMIENIDKERGDTSRQRWITVLLEDYFTEI